MKEQNQARVLVIDDQKLFLDAMAFEMELLGCKVDVAKEGKEAFAIFQKHKYDLVLSDIRMPEWDGLLFLEQIRHKGALTPPLVFMTGFADISLAEALALGAEGFIAKPVAREKLKRTVERLLKPIESRFIQDLSGSSAPVSMRYDMANPRDSESFQLGRGGFYQYAELPNGVNLGDQLQFDFVFSNYRIPSLKGSGEVVWIRKHEDHNRQPGYGVIITGLTSSCLSYFLEFVQQEKPLAVIPLGTRQNKAA